MLRLRMKLYIYIPSYCSCPLPTMQATLVLLAGIAYVATYEVLDPTANKVNLDIYYGGWCEGCEIFFLSQLKPTTQALSEYMEINLVPLPYNETVELITCMHACTLARVKEDSLQRVLMASCLFEYNSKTGSPSKAGKKCSVKFGLKWSEVSACATGPEGQALAKKYLDEIKSLKPPIKWVPTIAVNKYRGSQDYQGYVESHLEKVICSTLAKEKVTPAACANKTISS